MGHAPFTKVIHQAHHEKINIADKKLSPVDLNTVANQRSNRLRLNKQALQRNAFAARSASPLTTTLLGYQSNEANLTISSK